MFLAKKAISRRAMLQGVGKVFDSGVTVLSLSRLARS